MSVRSFTDLVDAFVVCDGTGELGGVGLVSVGVMAAVGVGVGVCIPCHGGCTLVVGMCVKWRELDIGLSVHGLEFWMCVSCTAFRVTRLLTGGACGLSRD